MANIDRIVDVQISLNTTGISKEGFSTMLIVGKHSNGSNRVDTFTSTAEMIEAGFAATDALYIAASDAFAQIPRPRVVKIGKWVDPETIAEAMTAIVAADKDFYGVCLASRDQDDILAMAEWTESNSKLFGCAIAEADALNQSSTTDTGSKLQTANYYRTFWFYHALAATEYPECAVMARCFAINPGGETWANKKLGSVSSDSLTETQYNAVTVKNGNTFEKFRNITITQNGKTAAGEWIDVIRFRDWLKEEISVNVFNVLINSDKIPYTDAGIAIIEAQIVAALKLGQDRGGIAPTEYDEDGNENLGFTVSVPLSSNISANTKASRILEDVYFTARLAGAIHVVEIKGGLTYENLIDKK